jgi:hypothetical protein
MSSGDCPLSSPLSHQVTAKVPNRWSYDPICKKTIRTAEYPSTVSYLAGVSFVFYSLDPYVPSRRSKALEWLRGSSENHES